MKARSVGAAALFTFLGLLLAGHSAFAYLELVRHGYVNCTACHVAPTGGGTLTPYGRELSREVLSTWGAEGEEKPAYFINTPEWLSLGGDYRSAYYYENTPRLIAASYQFMQADAEAAIQYKKFTFDASLGYQNPDSAAIFRDHLISRKHYIMYHFTDEIAARGGRFFPAYGIYSPNHSLLARDTLDIFQPEELGDGESYNLEASYIGENYNVIATGVFGRPDNPIVQRDQGATLVVSRALADHSKIGMSYLYGTNDLRNRDVFGPYAIVGFTPHFYLLSEADFQALTPKTVVGINPVQWGFAETSRLGYELVQGLHLVVDEEMGKVNFSDATSLQKRFGAGVWWYPRPHLEASFEYQKRQNLGSGFADYYDYLYFLWHLYI